MAKAAPKSFAESEKVPLAKITRNSARKNSFRKKQNHEKNKNARAALYEKHCGSSGWLRDVGEWHTTLRALSAGTL